MKTFYERSNAYWAIKVRIHNTRYNDVVRRFVDRLRVANLCRVKSLVIYSHKIRNNYLQSRGSECARVVSSNSINGIYKCVIEMSVGVPSKQFWGIRLSQIKPKPCPNIATHQQNVYKLTFLTPNRYIATRPSSLDKMRVP